MNVKTKKAPAEVRDGKNALAATKPHFQSVFRKREKSILARPLSERFISMAHCTIHHHRSKTIPKKEVLSRFSSPTLWLLVGATFVAIMAPSFTNHVFTMSRLLSTSLILLPLLVFYYFSHSSLADADCPAGGFDRNELDQMMRKWQAANAHAEKVGNWSSLADFYTDDAVYTWGMGPNKEFRAVGRDEIRETALGWYMKGFERWSYPYYDVLIDEQRGAIVAFYHQVAPVKRPNGEAYQVDGVSGSRFQYAGNFQWKRQTDFFDMGNVMALSFELARDGHLDDGIKEKVKHQAWGNPMPLVENIRPVQSVGTFYWFIQQLMQYLVMLRIVVLGK